MRIEFDHARNALAFLEYHQIEPVASNYQTALIHLSGTDKALSSAIASSIDAAALNDTRFVELGRLHASGNSNRNDAASLPGELAGDSSILERLTETERSLAELREQVAELMAKSGSRGGGTVDAEHDELTRALNQNGARRVLDRIVAEGQRYAVLMFGIDELVGINRLYGNSVGDNILNAFAAKLANIFSEHETIRWSGNEFLLVIPGQTMTALRAQAEEVLQLLEGRKFKLRGSGEAIGTVTGSAAMVADYGCGMEWAIEEARAKLQGAMLAGGNQVAM